MFEQRRATPAATRLGSGPRGLGPGRGLRLSGIAAEALPAPSGRLLGRAAAGVAEHELVRLGELRARELLGEAVSLVVLRGALLGLPAGCAVLGLVGDVVLPVGPGAAAADVALGLPAAAVFLIKTRAW